MIGVANKGNELKCQEREGKVSNKDSTPRSRALERSVGKRGELFLVESQKIEKQI